jgi:ABC-type lipoprotein release transport system permease subunit
VRRLLLLLRLALRNVRRQARRSLLTSAAIVLGLALQIFSRSLADGAHETWIDAAVRLGSGHVTIQHPDYLPRRLIEDRLAAASAGAAVRALAGPAVAPLVHAAGPRLEIRGLASSPRGAVPAMIVGVDPATDDAVSDLARRVTAGRALEAGDRLAAYAGEGLARRLRLEVGSRMVLTAQAADSTIAGQLVRIVGTFRTGVPEVDDGMLQMPLAVAQEWLGVGDDVSGIAVILRSSYDVPRVVDALRAHLSDAPAPLAVRGWRETSPELDSAVRIDDYGDYVFHAVLLLIVALAIVNTVLMAVLSRTREFGVLRALGLRRRDVAGLVVLEGTVLTLLGGLVGIGVGIGGTWLFFRNGIDFSAFTDTEWTAAGAVIDPVMIPRFRLANVWDSVRLVVGIGVAASLYPAWRATRIAVAEAMKFEG